MWKFTSSQLMGQGLVLVAGLAVWWLRFSAPAAVGLRLRLGTAQVLQKKISCEFHWNSAASQPQLKAGMDKVLSKYLWNSELLPQTPSLPSVLRMLSSPLAPTLPPDRILLILISSAQMLPLLGRLPTLALFALSA